MGSSSAAAFCKHKTCPSADTLLRYRAARLKCAPWRAVAAHLNTCDFCDAEMALLTKHTPTATDAKPYRRAAAKMPGHLYRLALDLLTLTNNSSRRTIEAIYDRDRLTLTDA